MGLNFCLVTLFRGEEGPQRGRAIVEESEEEREEDCKPLAHHLEQWQTWKDGVSAAAGNEMYEARPGNDLTAYLGNFSENALTTSSPPYFRHFHLHLFPIHAHYYSRLDVLRSGIALGSSLRVCGSPLLSSARPESLFRGSASLLVPQNLRLQTTEDDTHL